MSNRTSHAEQFPDDRDLVRVEAPAAPILDHVLDPVLPPRLRPSVRRPVGATRPLLRGFSHMVALPLSIIASVLLYWWVEGPRAEQAAIIFGCSVTLVFATSSALHRVYWPRTWVVWVRRIDHSAIFLMIAGIYTASWWGCLHGRPLSNILLAVVWTGAACGVFFKMMWVDAHRNIATIGYIVVGLSGVIAIPELLAVAGPMAVLVLVTSGMCFILGATAYILRWPEPWPGVFGFHEVFHLFVMIGVIMQFAGFALWLLPHR